ncbi:MAG: T9SS type A sorting domain-containing protein [Saprospiraceae bacterium]
MRKAILLIISVLCVEFCMAQSINIEENMQVAPLTDARNGSLTLGDIDNDGDPDLLVLGQDAGSLNTILYENDGNGNFTEITGTSFTGLQFGNSDFADVDNDGDLDLLYTGSNFSPEYFALLYLNDGNGNFILESNTPFQGSAGGEFVFEDIEDDGDLDLLMTGTKLDNLNNPEGFVALYVNDGSGTFTEVGVTPFEQVSSSSIAFIDVDNDNDNDVIIAGEDANDLAVTNLYTNDGMGNFSLAANTSIEGISTGDIAVADSDNDGDLDVHICGQVAGGDRISHLYLNDGTGEFSLVSGTPFPATFVGTSDFADFDADGDFDLLVTGAVGGAEFTSNIYENQGSNNFVLVDSLVDVYLTSTAIADIDGDNNLDVVISGISNDINSFGPRVYLNETITSLETIEVDESILIFPNPTTGVFQINRDASTSFSIRVFNSIGQLVYEDNAMDQNSQVKLNQPSGIYLITIESKNMLTSRKLILK